MRLMDYDGALLITRRRLFDDDDDREWRVRALRRQAGRLVLAEVEDGDPGYPPPLAPGYRLAPLAPAAAAAEEEPSAEVRRELIDRLLYGDPPEDQR
jgi:hypothetical protein